MSLPPEGSAVQRIIDTRKGFTLVEIIVVMVLVSIAGSLAGLGFSRVAQGIVFTQKNAATVQKGQVTLTKLVREFNNISAVDPAMTTDSMITFTSVKMESGNLAYRKHTVKRSPDTQVLTYITYDGAGAVVTDDVLTDQVSDFTLKYYGYSVSSTAQTTWQPSSRVIEVTLKLKGPDDAQSEFTARVRPRNVERK